MAAPVYEWQPMGWVMKGRDMVVRYYEHLISSFIPSTCGVRLVAQWASESSVAQEYVIDVKADGRVESHHVIGILYAEGSLLGGESHWTRRGRVGSAWA